MAHMRSLHPTEALSLPLLPPAWVLNAKASGRTSGSANVSFQVSRPLSGGGWFPGRLHIDFPELCQILRTVKGPHTQIFSKSLQSYTSLRVQVPNNHILTPKPVL